MATDVLYNTIVLHNVHTRQFHQETIMDPSGTDQIGQKFTLQVEGIMHLQSAVGSIGGYNQTPNVGPPGYSMGAGNLSNLYAIVRAKLSQPRGLLEVWVGPAGNQQRLFRCVPTTADTKTDPDRDISNGPKPKNFDIVQIAGSNLFRVSFTVECEKVECSQLNGGYIPVALNNRWSISEAMDSDFFITRTISGHLRISYGGFDSVNQQALSAFRYEPIVVPPLEDGFHRESITFSVAVDGLSADYVVVDKQVFTAPPWPATNWSGSHTESTAQGATYVTDLQVHLSGPPSAPTALLVARAIETAVLRLGILPKEKGWKSRYGDFILQHASLTTSIGNENAVDGRFRVQWSPKDKDTSKEKTTDFSKLFNARLLGHTATDIGKDTGEDIIFSWVQGQQDQYHPWVSPTPNVLGYMPHGDARDPTALALLTCLLQSPCADNGSRLPGQAQDSSESQQPNAKTYSTTITETKPSTSTTKATPNDYYSTATGEAMYTLAKMESRYIITPLRVQMPKAVSANSSDSEDSDEDACVFVELGPKQAQREILYEAERIGEPPQMPEPLDTYTDGKLKGTLLSATMSFCAPALSADGQTTIYRTTARYLYGLNRAPKKEETLRTGVLPFTNFTLEGTNSTDKVGTSVALEYAYSSQLGP